MCTTKLSPVAVTGSPSASISIPELSMATCPCGSHSTRKMAEGSASIVRWTSIRSLVRGWRQLRPWPDSREGLDRLRRRHVTATLSNGHLALLADLLKFADLRVDALLSAQLASGYKPDAKVYLTALRLLDCPPSEAGMVAAHGSDLRAAAGLALRPIFVRRPLGWGPGVPPADPPALDGLLASEGLDDLAEALGC